MKIKSNFFLIASLFFLIILVNSCNNDERKINVLVSLPLTGDAAEYGKLLKNGVEFGLSELNDKTRSKLNVIFQDDKLSSKDAVNILQQEMALRQLSVVITSSTELAMNLGPICNNKKIILLPPIADGDNITKAGEYVFLITPVSSFQGKELAKYIYEDGNKTAAVIYLNDAWGNGLSAEFVNAFKQHSGKILISEVCNPGQRDFRTQLIKIRNHKPDVILIILHPTETIPILKQIKELNIKSNFYGADTFSNKGLYIPEMIDLVQGIKFTLPSQPDNQIYKSFKNGFKKMYGYDADINTAAARDAIVLVGNAVEKGANNGETIKDFFKSKEFEFTGAAGKIEWDENRNVISKQYSLYSINSIGYELVSKKN